MGLWPATETSMNRLVLREGVASDNLTECELGVLQDSMLNGICLMNEWQIF